MLIAFEGIDGSGKGTQSRLLHDYFVEQGIKTNFLTFPTYEHTFFGQEVGHYLNGQFGNVWTVHPKLASILYAGDRYENRDLLLKWCSESDILICDRYTASNQAHHGAKLPWNERDEFCRWVEYLEFNVFKIPQPDVIIFLDVEPSVATTLIKKKPMRSYTESKADIHEIDVSYLQEVYATYKQLSIKPNWITIECVKMGVLLPARVINESILANIAMLNL